MDGVIIQDDVDRQVLSVIGIQRLAAKGSLHAADGAPEPFWRKQSSSDTPDLREKVAGKTFVDVRA